MSKVQSVVFDKQLFTPKTARKWLKKHDLIPIKHVDKTKNKLRYRLRQPGTKKQYNFRMKRITDGIQFVLQFPKKRRK